MMRSGPFSQILPESGFFHVNLAKNTRTKKVVENSYCVCTAPKRTLHYTIIVMSSPIEEIKARIDIVELVQEYVKLEKSGINFRAICPFHSEKTPSFFVSPARQLWHCFGGCNKGGDAFRFIMEIEGCDFPEALKMLAARAGVELKREDPAVRSERNRLYDINEAAARIFERTLLLTPEPKEYLKKRGVAEETVRQFRIGFAPNDWHFLLKKLAEKGFRPDELEKAGLAARSSSDSSYYDRFRGRIMFPIADANGRIVGFGGRIFDAADSRGQTRTEAKYLNTPQTLLYDKSRVLYGFDKAKNDIRMQDRVVIVEGYMDCVMSHQAGVKNTVAVSGTALTAPQLTLLKRLARTILSSFDTDAAGESATKRSLLLAEEFGFERRIVAIPSGKDPADTVLENPEKWAEAVESARPIVDFYFDKAFQKFDPATAEGAKAIAELLMPLLARLANEVEKAHWVRKIAAGLRITEDAVRKELLREEARGQNGYFSPEKAPNPQAVPLRRDVLEERFLALLGRMNKETRDRALSGRTFRFRSPSYAEVFAYLSETNPDPDPESEEKFGDILSILRFKSEIIEEMGGAPEQEFLIAAREFEKECVKDALSALEKKIEQKEREGNEAALRELLSEFQALSEKLRPVSARRIAPADFAAAQSFIPKKE